MTDEGFLHKIDGRFICLTAAILCHSLQCWRTGSCIDNVHQQKQRLLQTDRHCIWTQEIRLEHPVRLARP